MNKLGMIGIKNYFLIILSLILLTDLTIFLDIPILRQVFAFLCFTIIPGLLILHILKLNKIEFFKKFVLSVGLSIAFLMLIGLFLNYFYLLIGVSKPLSTSSLLISFTVILVILTFIGYNRNKDDFNLSEYINIKFNLKKDQFISPLLVPMIFPFLAVFGTYLMNTEGNNIILMLMLFLIPIYVVLVVYFRDRIPKITYPIAILMISVALLLMHGLTSNYIKGRDVHLEYYAFRVVTSYLYWSMDNYFHVLTACLSTSLLPTIYNSLLGLNGLYIYKLVFQLIGSIIPLVCYVLFKRYIGELYAFLASFFFMVQLVFLGEIQSAMRQEIALLFFALAMMVFFDDKIDKLNKKILFLIFMVSMIMSHYTTAYVFFFLISLSWLVIPSLKSFIKSKSNITAVMVMLCFVIIFFWYSQITGKGFDSGMHFVSDTFRSLADIYVLEARGQAPLRVMGIGAETMADKLTTVVHDIGFAFITLGVIGSIIKYKESKFDKEYLLMMLLCEGFLIALLIVPFLSIGYGSGRMYQQLLVLLAPAFIIGGNFVFKYIRPRIGLIVIIIVLVSQFFCTTYVVHQILGVPVSEELNREGGKYWEHYIYDQEVIAAKWLNSHNIDNLRIYSDYGGRSRMLMGCEEGKIPMMESNFFKKNETIKARKPGYIYLRHLNVVDRKIQPTGWHESIKNLTSQYSHLFVGKRKVYTNGGAEVYK